MPAVAPPPEPRLHAFAPLAAGDLLADLPAAALEALFDAPATGPAAAPIATFSHP